ncbi:putative phosphoglycerate mutase family protein [Ophiocordyceps camponoti-floridani]|uniref:Putative phosphoglycerate mutase family protein n=1 Tax=Ophiocordyceps camponoti-floridani TaxID=2030778 RepID=A0A8H4Q784_9HYPO|nr:putative phosphoglycerate mutase family protein [Ophiocordyceps camponoti-floridani]
MRPVSLLLLVGAALAAARRPTVYFIRHGEKPADKEDPYLSPRGEKRAQCIRRLFGADSRYDIGHIMAQRPRRNNHRRRPLDTVSPLAHDLGLDVDISCRKKDMDCVRDAIENYDGRGNILICWEHKLIKKIAKELGGRHIDKYPRWAYDEIWVDPYPYDEIAEVRLEHCPGLDDEEDARTTL